MSLIELRAVTPKRPFPRPRQARLRALMRDAGLELAQRMSYYPMQKPHVKYKRSGRYGQSWSIYVVQTGNGFRLIVINRMGYARYVGGFRTKDPRQMWWARAYGWRSIEDESKFVWRKWRPKMTAAIQGKS